MRKADEAAKHAKKKRRIAKEVARSAQTEQECRLAAERLHLQQGKDGRPFAEDDGRVGCFKLKGNSNKQFKDTAFWGIPKPGEDPCNEDPGKKAQRILVPPEVPRCAKTEEECRLAAERLHMPRGGAGEPFAKGCTCRSGCFELKGNSNKEYKGMAWWGIPQPGEDPCKLDLGNKAQRILIPEENVTDDPKGNVTDVPKGNVTDVPKGNVTDDPKGNVTDVPEGNVTDDPKGNATDVPKGNVTDVDRKPLVPPLSSVPPLPPVPHLPPTATERILWPWLWIVRWLLASL